ncbi:MAG: hypothetical protein KI791_18545 [Cyclobacteriaceae bacterium]|nr:hypothetical protein [Cyclobacteriaceae bacterium SS2]
MDRIISRFLTGAFLIVIFSLSVSMRLPDPVPVGGKVTVSMEGKDHVMSDLPANESNVKIDGSKYQFLFRHGEASSVQINLNLTDPDLMSAGAKTYQIPDSNNPNILVDLNFFDTKRESSRMNKRIIFRKGTITIESFTKDKLVMKFDGEGSGMMERDGNFKISGTVNVSF